MKVIGMDKGAFRYFQAKGILKSRKSRCRLLVNESRAYRSVRSVTAPSGRLSQEPFQIINPFCRPAFSTKHPLPAAWQIEWAKAARPHLQGVEGA